MTYVVVSQDENGRRSQQRAPRGQGHQQPKPARQGNMSYGTSQGNNNAGASSSSSAPQGSNDDQAPPPSYAQVVMGDNKIQDQSR